MSFWTYLLHCNGGYFYVGHTDDLDRRIAEHQAGELAGFTRDHLPVQLVWSEEFPTRYEAKEAERRVKGWRREKKLALIRNDWTEQPTIPHGKSAGQAFDKLRPGGGKMTAEIQRCGLIAVVGAPNAGKSTLVNALVGQKVAIVSPKAQTTRVRLMGVAIEGEAQLLLLDTPGIFEPRRRLDRAMVAAAWGGAQDADLIALVVDAKTGFFKRIEAMVDTLEGRSEPKILILNKVDVTPKEGLLTLIQQFSDRVDFEEIYMVSATTGDGIAELKAALAARMPQGPWHFPEDQVSDATDRMLAAEVTREQLYLQLRAELPYASAVETEKYEERRDGSVAIHQQILVGRATQKAIVLGKGGTRIRAIGETARAELSELLGKKVHLFLHVKVKPDWEEDRGLYREIGLDWVE
jgi:GTP-binding protein Era